MKFMVILQNIGMFVIGGGGYVALELLWRGRSHFAMFLAGGLCFLLLGQLNRVNPRLPLWLRCLVGAGIVTVVELGVGLLANRDYTIWDYRQMPVNFHGQICLVYSLLWIPVSLMGMGLHKLAGRLFRSADPGQGPA